MNRDLTDPSTNERAAANRSPYFFNFGLFNTASLLHSLSTAFVDALIQHYPLIGLPSSDSDASTPQVLFGPAYKGIPLVSSISTLLASRGRGSVGFAYNRKEAKTHGEGGSIVGSSLTNKRVLIIDDVITAGTAIREAHSLVIAEGGTVVGLVVALDRQERGTGTKSTVQEVEEGLGVGVVSVVKMVDITEWLRKEGRGEDVIKMEAYRKEYGIQN